MRLYPKRHSSLSAHAVEENTPRAKIGRPVDLALPILFQIHFSSFFDMRLNLDDFFRLIAPENGYLCVFPAIVFSLS